MLMTAFFLQACSLQPTLTPNQVQETAIAAPFCTLVGCWDNLLIKFTGESPIDFIVKVEDISGRVGAIECLENKQTESTNQYGTTNRYLLNAPEAKKINQVSSILSFCKSNNGYFNVTTWEDGSIESIVVQCFEAEPNEFGGSCWDKAVSFQSFSPSELKVSVYWNDKIKFETIKPVYESWYPNGQGCEPECQISTVNIELP